MKKLHFEQWDLTLEEQPNRQVRVTQKGRAYLARDWALSEEVVRVIKLALSQGLGCMIQDGHPERHRLLFDQGEELNGKGTVYLSFSRTPEEWVFVLDDKSMQKGQLRRVAFKNKFGGGLIGAVSGAEFEKRNKEQKHVWVPIQQLENALNLITQQKTPAHS